MSIHVRARHIAVAAVAIAGAAAIALGLAAPAAPAARARASALTGATARIPRCTAADLGVWVAADQTGMAAGTTYMQLEFTNLGRHACTLRGFPDVAAMSTAWRQLGRPATRDRAVRARTVQLAPGATGHALLEYGDAIACKCPAASKATAFALRVYPPGQRQPDHALWDLGTCSARGSSKFLRVSVIASGIGVRGDSG